MTSTAEQSLDSKTLRIFLVADGLWARGVRPSGRKVLAALGKGSLRDVSPAVSLWWEKLPDRQKAKDRSVEPAAQLDTGDMVPRAVMDARITEIEERVEGERRHLMLETDRMRQEIVGPLQAVIDRLKGEMQKLDDQVLFLQTKVSMLERERK